MRRAGSAGLVLVVALLSGCTETLPDGAPERRGETGGSSECPPVPDPGNLTDEGPHTAMHALPGLAARAAAWNSSAELALLRAVEFHGQERIAKAFGVASEASVEELGDGLARNWAATFLAGSCRAILVSGPRNEGWDAATNASFFVSDRFDDGASTNPPHFERAAAAALGPWTLDSDGAAAAARAVPEFEDIFVPDFEDTLGRYDVVVAYSLEPTADGAGSSRWRVSASSSLAEEETAVTLDPSDGRCLDVEISGWRTESGPQFCGALSGRPTERYEVWLAFPGGFSERFSKFPVRIATVETLGATGAGQLREINETMDLVALEGSPSRLLAQFDLPTWAGRVDIEFETGNVVGADGTSPVVVRTPEWGSSIAGGPSGRVYTFEPFTIDRGDHVWFNFGDASSGR